MFFRGMGVLEAAGGSAPSMPYHNSDAVQLCMQLGPRGSESQTRSRALSGSEKAVSRDQKCYTLC